MKTLAWWLGSLWTAPNTVLGLLAGGALLCAGAGVRVSHGAVEFHGRPVAWLLARFGAGALTLGQVILGRDEALLDHMRMHEHEHIRQYMILGPLFLPLYGLESLRASWAGSGAWNGNLFERAARRAERANPHGP